MRETVEKAEGIWLFASPFKVKGRSHITHTHSDLVTSPVSPSATHFWPMFKWFRNLHEVISTEGSWFDHQRIYSERCSRFAKWLAQVLLFWLRGTRFYYIFWKRCQFEQPLTSFWNTTCMKDAAFDFQPQTSQRLLSVCSKSPISDFFSVGG